MKTSNAIRLFLFMAMLTIFIAPVDGFTDSKAIYDGRLSLEPAKLSPQEESLFRGKILPAARASWRGEEANAACGEGSEARAVDIAQGSFTRPNSVQTVFLYTYCITGHNFALDGVAVIEDDKVVSHLVYEGDWENAIGALPDINGNGRSEILIASGGTSQGVTWGYVRIIELSESSVTKFGGMKTYSENCGVDEKKGSAEAYRLSAQTGGVPVFHQEAFIDRGYCKDKSGWRKSGTRRPISLKEDTTEYEFIQ